MQAEIEAAFDQSLGHNEDVHLFEQFLRGLNAGAFRAASPDASSPTGWTVNSWVKKGILLGFRVGHLRSIPHTEAGQPFFDKSTYPLKHLTLDDKVRVVPGGSAIRSGAYVAPGVTCMPPMYINVGAYVDEGTMVDSHALVGSCAQIGKRAHLSAGAQIGGVLEPVGAMPVVIEDDVLVGGNAGVYEGTIVKKGAVLGTGTLLNASTPLYDLVTGEVHQARDGLPLVVPENAVVVPGSRAIQAGRGKEWGLSLNTPIIVKYKDDKTGSRIQLEELLR